MGRWLKQVLLFVQRIYNRSSLTIYAECINIINSI